MAREKELFRDNLQRLDEQFPNAELLPLLTVAHHLGMDKRTLLDSKGFPARKLGRFWMVSKVALAAWLS